MKNKSTLNKIALIQLWPAHHHHFSSQIANYLGNNFEITVFTSKNVPIELYQKNIKVIKLPFNVPLKYRSIRDYLYFALNFRNLPYFLMQLRSFSPDLINIVYSHPYNLIPAIICRILRKPVIINRHDAVPHLGENTFFHRLYYKLEILVFTGFITHSRLAQKLLEGVVSKKEIWMISHWNLNFINPQKQYKLTSQKHESILFFGRVYRYKGINVLLEAIPDVIHKFPNVVFTIAGEGDWDCINKKLLQKIPSKNLCLQQRYVPDSEVPSLFNHASMVVLPYIDASQSGVIPFAAAFRCAVIASNLGAMPEYIQSGKTGLLVEPNDPVDLSEKIQFFLKNKKAMDSCASALHEYFINKYSSKRIRSKYIQCYKSFIPNLVID